MFEDVTFEMIMDRMLSKVPGTMDKREGSIIYDALAPAAIELQLIYMQLDIVLQEAFADTASRDSLIRKAAERGLKPEEATFAVVKGEFSPISIEIPVASRFNLDENNYQVIEKIIDGQYRLRCETAGSDGNRRGQLIPVEEIEGLETAAITEILIPGEDAEDTEDFRRRYFDSFDSQAFGGNIADYKQKTKTIDGVGGCKVYPVWNGGGTVKLVITDSTSSKPSAELVNVVQSDIDPEVNKGKGYGIAPIGHTVTVAGVDEQTINIQTEIVFSGESTLESSINSLRAAVDKYFLSLAETWEDEEKLVVRISQIEYNLLECAEVLDVSATAINGEAANLILGSDEIPKRGTINGI